MEFTIEADNRPISPLSDARFLETHVEFEGSSTQQDQIREALAAHPLGPEASALSVGPGSGILDGPLVAELAETRTLRYVGVEPNPLQSRQLADRLAPLPVDAEVVTGTFESYGGDETFDVVWVIHTHYYFSNVPEGLAHAARRVAAEGRLVLAAAPFGALNQLSQLYWADHASDELWFSEKLDAFLRSVGVQAERQAIAARLDVTPCFEGLPRGDAIRDFIVQAEVSERPEARARVDGLLRDIAQPEADERWTVPHPVDLFEIDAEGAARLARA